MVKTLIKPKMSFKVSIRGELWNVNLYTKTVFERVLPETMAITDYDPSLPCRGMYFRGPKPSKDTIAHELMHAHMFTRDTVGKSYGAVEEIACEVVGKHYRRIYELTDLIYKKFTAKQKKRVK